MTATAKEAESGGEHRPIGDDYGGKRRRERAGDDHPNSHGQNGTQT